MRVVVPNDDRHSYFSSFSILKQIKNKHKIKIELNEDKLTNQKKIDIIRYEARKLKYSKDTSSIIDINFTKEITYKEILQLLFICYKDEHKRFVFFKNRFIIFGEYLSKKMK